MSTAAEFLERHLSQLDPRDDLGRLFPILEMAAWFDADRKDAYQLVEGTPFAVAWTVLREPNVFNYLAQEGAAYLDAAGVNWRAIAYRNLEALARAEPANGQKEDEAGSVFIQVMLHGDSMGPSRLLVPYLLAGVFGEDYRVAIPEQTCAVAYRTNLRGDPAFVAETMVESCFAQGTTPMSSERFDPEIFWAPARMWLDGGTI